ncbi:MAG: acyl carrier protein [Planctomycetes bacterium]|nr:acyl carrier protein [Planctomycetota bacterium]
MILTSKLKTEILSFLDVTSGEADIGISESLLESGLLDSMNILELVAHLQKVYGVEFTTEEMTHRNFETIEAIGRLLKEKKVSIEHDNIDNS